MLNCMFETVVFLMCNGLPACTRYKIFITVQPFKIEMIQTIIRHYKIFSNTITRIILLLRRLSYICGTITVNLHGLTSDVERPVMSCAVCSKETTCSLTVLYCIVFTKQPVLSSH